MSHQGLTPNPKWIKESKGRGSRGRGTRGYEVRKLGIYMEQGEGVPELLRLKKIQQVWDTDDTQGNIAA